MNRNLLQYNSTAEEMHKEQERIKTSIINFIQVPEFWVVLLIGFFYSNFKDSKVINNSL